MGGPSRLALGRGVILLTRTELLARSGAQAAAAGTDKQVAQKWRADGFVVSDAEMEADHAVGQLVDGAARHAPAFFENAELAGHAPREGEFLLDQEHSHADVPVEREDDVADLVHEVRLNAFGGLVQ